MNCIFINTSLKIIKPELLENYGDIYYISCSNKTIKEKANYLSILENEKRAINKNIFSFVLKWGEKYFEGNSVNEYLTFSGFNLWQYHRFRVYFEVRNIKYEIKALTKLQEKGYKKIYVISDLHYNRKSFIKDIDFVLLDEIFEKSKKDFKNLFKYFLVIILRIIIGLWKLLTMGIKNTKSIIIDGSLKQACLTENGEISYDNYNLAYLFDKIDKSYLIISEIIPPKSGEKFSLAKIMNYKNDRTRQVLYSEIILIKAFISISFRHEFKEIKNKIENKYHALDRLFSDPYDRLILEILNRHQSTNYFYLFRYLSYRNFFNKSKIQRVVALDENGPMSRAVLDAAKVNNLKTIGIQHGAIHELHPNYSYSKNEIKYIPDYTIVWGSKWADLLVNFGNYPRNSLFIAGQIRTDIIPKLLKKRINNTIFTVVYASQPQRDKGLREKTAQEVFDAVSKIPEILLKVKLHPQEFNDYHFYQKLALDSGVANFEILNNAELYLVLASADVVITSFSTVGIEAIYFDKPLIIYDPLKQDLQKYHEEGVAFQALDSNDIYSFLMKIKKGENVISESHYRNFIHRNAFKIDGHVADRCIEFIDSVK